MKTVDISAIFLPPKIEIIRRNFIKEKVMVSSCH